MLASVPFGGRVRMKTFRSAGLFLAADLFLIGLHVTLYMLSIRLGEFNIEADGAYPEFYQHLKWYWLICLSFYLGVRLRQAAYVLLVPVFTLLLIDDAFSLHEVWGADIASRLAFTPPFGLRRQDIGELWFFLVSGLTVFVFWAFAYHFASVSVRKHIAQVGKFLMLLAGFGVALDAIHTALRSFGKTVYFIAGTLEDGGEMITLSLLLGCLVRYALECGAVLAPRRVDRQQSGGSRVMVSPGRAG